MPTPDPENKAEPLSGFKEAFAKYQKCQADFVDIEDRIARGTGIYAGSAAWKAKDLARRIASEGLWVSGLAGFFNLLEVNYKAQERLVSEQLKLAEKSSQAADKVAWWTQALVVVTVALILTTALVGLFGPIFARAQAPVEVHLMAPESGRYLQTPVVIPADQQSPQSPPHDP